MGRYQDAAWRESMRLKVDFNNMMEGMLGKHGIAKSEISALSGTLAKAALAMEEKRPKMKWRELPYNQEEIVADIENTVKSLSWCEDFVVLGIGGSALGPLAVQQALNHLHYNDLPRERRGGPRLFVEDNVDPERMQALLDVIDPAKTVFNVVTKSGGTSETMSQLLIVTSQLEKLYGRDALSKHVIATTDEKKGNLIKIAKALGLKTYYVPDGVGGPLQRALPRGPGCPQPSATSISGSFWPARRIWMGSPRSGMSGRTPPTC